MSFESIFQTVASLGQDYTSTALLSKKLIEMMHVSSGELVLFGPELGEGVSGYTQNNRMYISNNGDPVNFCVVLAHELAHTLQGEPPRALEHSLGEFVEKMLMREVQARLKDIEVSEELYQHGCDLHKSAMAWLNIPPDLREAHLHFAMRKTKVSIDNQSYEQFFSDHWREIHNRHTTWLAD